MPLKLKGTLKPGQVDRRYYMIRVQVDDRRVSVSSGTRDRALAEKKEALIVEALMEDRDISQAQLVALVRGDGHVRHVSALRAAGGLTLKLAFDRCFADPHVWRGIKAYKTYRTNCDHVLRYFKDDRPIASMTSADIQGYVVAQLDAMPPSAPGTINRRLACLGRMFSAMSELPDGPKTIPKVKYLQENGARKFSLNHEQEKNLFDEVAKLDLEEKSPRVGRKRKPDGLLYLRLYRLLVETGMRLSEALKLRWSDIQKTPEGTGVIRLYRTEEIKNNKARSVPLTEAAMAVIDELKAEGGRIHGPFSDLNKRRAEHVWTTARDRAGIDDPECVIHSLRHTCATRLLRATGNIALVKEWLGHTTIKTTADIYAHVETDSLMDGAAALTTLRGTSLTKS